MIGPIYQGFFRNKGSTCGVVSLFLDKNKMVPFPSLASGEWTVLRHVGLVAGEHERILHCSGGDPLSAPLTFKSLNFQTQYPSLSLTHSQQTDVLNASIRSRLGVRVSSKLVSAEITNNKIFHPNIGKDSSALCPKWFIYTLQLTKIHSFIFEITQWLPFTTHFNPFAMVAQVCGSIV